MKIAIAIDGNSCSEHFGHCSGFKVYDIENKEIKDEFFIKNPGHKPGFLPLYLSNKGIDVIVSNGMGGRAQSLFKEQGVKVVVGAFGIDSDIIKRYINNELVSDESICNKHEYEGNCN